MGGLLEQIRLAHTPDPMPWVRLVCFSFDLLTSLSACNVHRLAAKMTGGVLLAGSSAIDREPDLALAEVALPAALKTMETFLVNAPHDKNLTLLLARGYGGFAFGFLERDLEHANVDGDPSVIATLERRTRMHYLRARDYGLALLPKAVRAAVLDADTDKLDAALAKTTARDVPGLFWTGYGFASAVNLSKSDPNMVAFMPVVERIMKRVYDLDRDYESGAVIVFFGVYEASKPAAFGGRPVVAKAFFEEAIARHGASNMLTHYFYGRFYGTMMQDKALYERELHAVMQADLAVLPQELRLQNEIARQRARFWLENVEELIL